MNFSISYNRLLWVLLAIIGVVTFFPLCNLGFTTGDDFEYYFNAQKTIPQWFAIAERYAEHQGRFTFPFAQWVFYVPYLVDAEWYYHTTLVFPILSSFGLFAWLVYRLSKNLQVVMLLILAICAIFFINTGWSSFASYPFYFTFSFTLFFTSLHLLISYFRTNKYSYLLISSIIFAWTTTFYEVYLFYYLVFAILILYRYEPKKIFEKNNLKKIIKEISPYAFWAILFIAVYVIYAKMHPSGYKGNTMASDFSFFAYQKKLVNYIVNSLPLSSVVQYKNFILERSTQLMHSQNLLLQASAISYVKGILVVIIFLLIIKNYTYTLSKKAIGVTVIISFLFIVFPHVLLALTESRINTPSKTYVTTAFSLFAVILFVFISLIAVYQKVSNTVWLHKIFIYSVSVVLFIVTVLTQYANEVVAKDIEVNMYKFDAMDALYTSKYIAEDNNIYFGSLHYTPTSCANVTAQSDKFSAYIFLKSNISVKQYVAYEKLYKECYGTEKPIVLSYYKQAKQTGDAMLVLAYCTGKDLKENMHDMQVDSMVVGYVSAHKTFTCSVLSDTVSDVYIYKNRMENNKNLHVSQLEFDSKRKVSVFKITGKKLLPSSLQISNMQFQKIIL